MTDATPVFDDVPLTAIRIDGGTQARTAIDQEVVAEYAEAMRQGEVFPPLVVFFDGAEFWLADGFHRYHASLRAGVETVRSEIHTGLLDDAKLHAAGANRGHGLRRTNADKRNAVNIVLAVPKCQAWSDREIARQCGVGASLVADVRKSICTNNADSPAPATRTVTRNGTTYEQKVKARPAPVDPKPSNSMELENPVSPANGIGTEPTIATARLAPEQGAVAVTEFEALKEENAQLRAELGELAEQFEETLLQAEAMRKVLEADAPLQEAFKQLAQAQELNRVLETRLHGLTNEKNEVMRRYNGARHELDRLKAVHA
jgi:hypothetical protein